MELLAEMVLNRIHAMKQMKLITVLLPLRMVQMVQDIMRQMKLTTVLLPLRMVQMVQDIMRLIKLATILLPLRMVQTLHDMTIPPSKTRLARRIHLPLRTALKMGRAQMEQILKISHAEKVGL